MVTLSPASIVIVRFPFSDLSGAKLRPAVVISETGRDDWLLCQVTSSPQGDADVVQLTESELERGSLAVISYARPMKLFTANESIIVKRVGILQKNAFNAILIAIITSLKKMISQ